MTLTFEPGLRRLGDVQEREALTVEPASES